MTSTPCPACRSSLFHRADCPAPDIEQFQAGQIHMRCAECGMDAVDRNDEDLFECRECHTQYQRQMGGKPRFVTLKLQNEDALFVVLPKKGAGHFSFDKPLKKARKLYNKMVRKNAPARKRS